MIKLIATDLDGTLLNDEGKLNNDFYKIVDKLSEKGIIFAAASGRFYSTLCDNFKKVNSNMLVIGHNGGIIKYINNGDTLYKDTIKPEIINKVIDIGRENNLQILLCNRDFAYLENPSKDLLESLQFGKSTAVILNSVKEVKDEIFKITFFEKGGVRPHILKLLQETFKDELECVVSGKEWLDIMNKGVSKGKAIKLIQNKFNIKQEETMVFGDYYNDVPMFKRAYYSYAVENAPMDVKKHANFITKTNNEDGVLHAIRKIL
ncbi:flavin mononucleotide phosphatase YbjI [Clostridium acetireducens DSM 10703]|uniref:Flavin mononucleotide phosphatase YbjI n=1 Tax=Clostridium acetireducens DSM 10703 TaxID=1121290 RepID=A0A1E8F0X6_9CLOT|nr:Cof-type HAD-IIB family hydrolase [Clostridium acetireducens]OFI07077.1 flavin mononucleotide phosphatase YbjI [Clostridium acetireducens DSM 10703]